MKVHLKTITLPTNAHWGGCFGEFQREITFRQFADSLRSTFTFGRMEGTNYVCV